MVKIANQTNKLNTLKAEQVFLQFTEKAQIKFKTFLHYINMTSLLSKCTKHCIF